MSGGVDDDGRERELTADFFSERAPGGGRIFQGETDVAEALRILSGERHHRFDHKA